MRTLKILAATSLTLASFAAFAYTPGAGITGTPHDWSSPVTGGGTGGGQSLIVWCKDAACTGAAPPAADANGNMQLGANTTTYNTGFAYNQANGKPYTYRVQIGQCTKCHTPHQAKSTNLLWNHTLSTNTYSWDQPATTAGTAYPFFKGDNYKGPTTKCLTCHDGSMASTDGMWFNRQNTSGTKYVAAPGSLNSGHEVSSSTGNMSGSHPVAMPYPFGGAVNMYNKVATGTQTTFSEFIADPQPLGIRLFNDDGTGNITAGAVAGKAGMECTSCHDVHNGTRTMDQLLLTGKLTGTRANGYICQQCHAK